MNRTRLLVAVAAISVICAGLVAFLKYGVWGPDASFKATTRTAPSYCAPIFDELSELRCQIRVDFKTGVGFDPKQASKMLADFRLEGKYPVCAANAQITSERYIELAISLQALSSAQNMTSELMERFAVISNSFVNQPRGMSDCDWRVMEQLFAMHPPK